MTDLWRRVDKLSQGGASKLSSGDHCYFLMDRVAGGWDKSEANRLIANLKKPVSRKGLPDWHYKNDAIEEFARDLAELLNALGLRGNSGVFLVPIPPSKAPSDPAYDDRIIQVASRASKAAGVKAMALLHTKRSTYASHMGGTRSILELKDNLCLRSGGLVLSEASLCVLVDDVITSGAHYVACRQILQEACSGLPVIGAFWAKQVPSCYEYESDCF